MIVAPERGRRTGIPAFEQKWRALLAAASLLASLPANAQADVPASVNPQRIVSLNLCADQLLADLVARERIAGVSFLGLDPTMSVAAGKLAGVRTLQGTAEEVLALEPDLVVAGEFSTPATLGMLRRLGVPVVVVPLANDLDGIRAAIRTLATAVGEPARGAALVAGMDRALAAVHAPRARRPTAIAYQVNGLVSGRGSLVDAILDAAGYENRAASARLGPGGRLALETLLADPPDLVVLAHGPDEFRTAVADNLRHPALQALLARRPSIRLRMEHWLCGTPAVAEAVRELAALRSTVLDRPRP